MNPLLDLVDPVTEDDIEWVSGVLRLQKLDTPRRDFLMSLDSMDVSACPGSGKTTLVVAKLAILVRKWKSPTRGMCVLSHTNVARKEIEERLSGADIGHLLLGYPHYIDTIHGFANRFLAIPWLLSHGHIVTAIDNEVAAAVRRRNMEGEWYGLQKLLKRNHTSVEELRLMTADFDNPLDDSKFPAGPHTPSYQTAARALSESARQGFFCHDEMLLFAEALLQEHPEIGNVLPQRFPFLILDETQDTSARQANIIESSLPFSQVASVQRVGDPNQAIYEGKDTETDSRFPDQARLQVSLPNSFRFDNSIASRANALAVEPVGLKGLQGLRTPKPDEPDGRHCIFIFPDNDPSQVLPAFAAHVASVMDAAKIENGSVIAVGEVHRPKDEVPVGHDKFPATVSHYWDGYHADAASRSARPKELIRNLRAARTLIEGGRSAEAADMIASGIARIANMLDSPAPVRLGTRPHRGLERQLAESPPALAAYRALLLMAAPGAEDSETKWRRTADAARLIVATLLGIAPQNVRSPFLNWIPLPVNTGEGTPLAPPGPNTYRVSTGGRVVDVQLGSIHSVKGETHFATLVLETFYYGHALKSLLPRLLGIQPGSAAARKKTQSTRDLHRLRMNYVALSRSTHVVCLAVPEKSLGPASQKSSLISEIEAQGWKIVEIPGAPANPRAVNLPNLTMRASACE